MHRFLAARLLLVLRAFAVGGMVSGVAAAPAHAAVSLGGAPGGLQALAVSGGAAYAVVDSGNADAPFALVRSNGSFAEAPRHFGDPGAEFPDLATGPGDSLAVSWGQAISNGDRYVVADAPTSPGAAFGAAQPLANATGPGRLVLDPAGTPLLAFPDGLGDTMLARVGAAEERMTATAPEQRHLPLDVAVDAEGRAFVLELVQTRRRSELRLLGPGAPAAPVVAIDALRDMRATLALDGGRAYVAFVLDGRARLAIAALDPAGGWWSRRLPGRGGGTGAAVMRSGGSTLVAYTQRQQHGRGDVFFATDGPNSLRIRRLTRTRADERAPFAAAGAGGELYAGWSRGSALRGPGSGVLLRLR